MLSATDSDKLQQIMDESPEKKELLQKLLDTHKMDLRTISHEIRNPLTLVYSTMQLLKKQHPELSSYAHWRSMCEDIEYMKLLLEELSTFHNSGQITPLPFDTAFFLKVIALSFASSLVDTGIEFTSKIEPDLPVLTGDSIRLKEVLLNLLRNATEAVSCDGHIQLHAYTNGKCVHIDILDDGCGISPENLPHIFDPFVTHKQGGTGLGLAIAKQVVEAHGGSLTVVSSQDVSTTFSLSLPIEKNS